MSDLIPQHGGYRQLKGFQIAQLAYDVTVVFVDRYISRFSRTCDQMVQAARSGVQNIAEGSLAAATSKKTELKLTQVARASLEELKLDYEDFLRQRGLPQLDAHDPILMRFKAARCQNVADFRAWVQSERLNGQARTVTDLHGPLPSSCLAANGALSLLNLACYLIEQQVEKLALDFEREGGFTERLYRIRKGKRNQ